jgi:hypothetical protein
MNKRIQKSNSNISIYRTISITKCLKAYRLKNIIVLLLVLLPVLLFAQEDRNAANYIGAQTNTARTDGKPEINPSSVYQKPEQVVNLEKMIYEIRKSGNPDPSEVINLQKQIDAITNQSVTMKASFYPGQVTPSAMSGQSGVIGSTLLLMKSNVKCLATVTEYTGATAGRIWAVVGFQGTGSGSTPDSLRVLYSADNGNTWIPYADITLGGTDKLNPGDIDAELIEGGTYKYLHIVYGLRASGGTGKWFAAGASIRLTGTFLGSVWSFYWPGDDAAKRYYCPRIISDNVVWPTSPWAYVAVSFDSAGASGRVNTQKFAQLNGPNTVNPVFSYKTNKIYWYSETATQQNLFTDIAFYQRNFVDSIIISFSGVADSTKVFFSKMNANGAMISPSAPGQYIGPIGGSEPNYMKYGGRLSSNGNNNGSIFFIFNQKSAATDGVKYFRTTNYGDFNNMYQSVFWTASAGVSMPDIVGVRNSNTHSFGFVFKSTVDSLQYVSVTSEGFNNSVSARMNSVNFITDNFPPAVGIRSVPNDNCFALYSANGQMNVYSAYGCSGIITNTKNTEIPVAFDLKQNYPNPFNPVTRINYSLPKSGLVTLKVYDILGKEVAVLVNDMKNAGNYSVDFNASDMTSGVYFYKLTSAGLSHTKVMALIK